MPISKAAAKALDKLMTRREKRLAKERHDYAMARKDLHSKPRTRVETPMESLEPMSMLGRSVPSWGAHVTAQPIGHSLGNGAYRR